MCYNNEEISNPADIVNAFGNYFHSVFIHSTPIDPASLSLQQCVFNNTVSVNEISVDDVRKHLQRSKNSQTTGVDGVPSFLLRDCASVLAAPLAKIFNRMLQYSTFPDIWKKAFICPVLKKGKTNDVTNYRPISLLCNFAKTFESIIYETIYNSVKPFISSYQHGFMANRSTVSNLAVFSQYLSDSLDDKCQVDVIYTDFQKAFDRIDHYVLLEKLSRFGFSEPLLKLIQSYLFDREFRVRYRNFTSVAFVPTSGVPQGSNLGPLLFLLFINDLAESVSCKKSLFADDFKLFSIINSVSDCFLLQQNLNSVTRWCDSNRLQLNISKCRVVSYSRKQDIITYSYNVNGILMERSQTFKDLGVVFDSKLAFIDHINTTVNSASKIYGFIYRNCRRFSNVETIRLLFCSLVRSRLEYASLIWYPIYDVHCLSLESVQRRFLKFMVYLEDGIYPPRGCEQSLLLSRYNLLSLETRRNIIAVRFVYNLFHNKIDCTELLSQFNLLVGERGACCNSF